MVELLLVELLTTTMMHDSSFLKSFSYFGKNGCHFPSLHYIWYNGRFNIVHSK